MSKAAQDVLAERTRQISKEGWTYEHDDAHTGEELAIAAACYAMGGPDIELEWHGGEKRKAKLWPWHIDWWKPRSKRENLVRAGALILAEIERLDRAEAAK